jgi:cytochrome oxidase Cu insertion factor (SCO1/SenC/PrrC family)
LGGDAAGKWLLVVAGNGACEAECVAQLRNLRSIQVSLGREIGRMRRVVLTSEETSALAALRAEQPDLMQADPTAGWVSALSPGTHHRVFLVDPAGNLMMQYAPGAEPKGIRADLERLLKYSWIG